MSPARKNLIMLGILFVLGAALGLYAYFGIQKPDEREAQRKEAAEKLLSAQSPESKSKGQVDGGAPLEAEFTSINVKAKGEATTVEKRDSKWWITSPVSSLADKWAVDQLINQVKNTKFKATVEENPTEADLEKYGLKEPKFTVNAYYFVPGDKGQEANDPARRRKITFYGGIENTFDGSVYLRREGDKAVYLVDGAIRYSIDKSTFDLRDKEVLALDEPGIKRVEVTSRNRRYALERDEKKNWRLIFPKAMPADNSSVSSMLSELRGARATGFPKDSLEERQHLGFKSPTAEAVLTLASGEPIRLRFSTVAGDGGEKSYVLREQGSESLLAEIPAAPIKDLSKDPSELRDKSVLSFAREEVAKVVFSNGGAAPEIIVQREVSDGGASDDWQLTSPSKGRAKKWKVSSVLWSLGSLKAASFGEENPKDWEKYGISDSSRRVVLIGADGKLLAKLLVGKNLPGKSDTLYAKGSRDQVVQIDSAKLSDVPQNADEVLDIPPPSIDGGSQSAAKK